MKKNLARNLVVAALLAGAAHLAAAATVDWRQGSGNSGKEFTVSSGAVTLAGDTEANLTLGLRAVQRNVGTITPTGNVYAANAGFAAGSTTRAWWNFDIFAGLNTGFLSTLSALTLQITTVGGSAPSASSFNLLDSTLRASIDCHVIGCVNGNPVNPDALVADLGPGNDGAPVRDAALFYNASQNATFAPWFSGFDVNQSALYNFTLTAVDARQQSLSTSMQVNVGNFVGTVPEPGSLLLVAGALLGLAASARRKA